MDTNDRHPPPLAGARAWSTIRLFVEQAPNLKYADYAEADQDWRIGRRAYEAAKRQIGRDRTRALTLLEQCAGHPYNRAALEQATQRAYHGRLRWSDSGELEYTAGQDPATERRAAIVALLRYYLDIISQPRRIAA